MITEDQVKQKTPKRFWEKISFDSPDKCWLWNSVLDKNEYGRFTFKRPDGTFKKYRVNRLIYEFLFDDFKEELMVLHSCPDGKDNPRCCNPNHLRQGTAKNNAQDMMERGRFKSGGGNKTKGSERKGIAKLDEGKVELIRKRLEGSKEPYSVLANEFGVSEVLIGKIRSGESWAHAKGAINKNKRKNHVPHIGSKNGRATLTEDIVGQIKKMLSNDVSSKEIENLFNIKQGRVSAIKTGASWKHVQI